MHTFTADIFPVTQERSADRFGHVFITNAIIQLLKSFCLQISWVVIWMIFDENPKAKTKHYETPIHELRIECNSSRGETIGVMVWNIFIVLICCTFAFLTRKLPENYNESKFIAFCSFCSLVVLSAFSTTYFIVSDAFDRSGFMSLALIVNATVTLHCLCTVKFYAIYFVSTDEIHIGK